MKSKTKYVFMGLIIVLIICAVLSVVYMNSRYDVIEDISDLKESAENSYKNGDVDNAIFQLEAYCNNVVIDTEAKIMLGDWYMALGDDATAYKKYYEAAQRKQPDEEIIPSLTVRNTKEVLTQPVGDVVIEITPDVRYTKDMTLTVTGNNLTPDEIHMGRISDLNENLVEQDGYYTTDWFEVDSDGEYLTMSGNFNCAIWQFRNELGEIIATAKSENRYRTKDSYDTNIYQMARVSIPDSATACRVTYFDLSKAEETAGAEEKLIIVYGRLPGESKDAKTCSYQIPDLVEGEKIVFGNDQWTFVDKAGFTTVLNWEIPDLGKGSYFRIDGLLPGKVYFGNSRYSNFSKDGIYTIRFDVLTPTATGERLDDAKNLGYNATIGDSFFTVGENHFDNIYPWSEMKLCAIKDGTVVYAGEEGFATNGSSGDVFVEIPKFYVRRIVGERYETISISGEMHEGFQLDEAFMTENGEVDKIYIAAYLTGEDENGFNSAAGELPVLSLSAEELIEKTEAKGSGYKEIDYAALSAVQKLFMVETGIRNSQYLFMGICAYTLPSDSANNTSVALTDKEKTNCIEVRNKHTFIENNNIVILNLNEYENSDVRDMDVRKITTVINNGDGTQSVYFSGDPISITKGVTAIAHIVTSNGTSGSVNGHTGAVSTARGTVAFKYRNIENLWGNAYVLVDKVTVKNSIATITDRQGNRHDVLYSLPQKSDDILESMINKIGYDIEYNGVMLPCLTNEGATISTHYGDAYIDNGVEDEDNLLYYGGAWNTKAAAGLFSYMVSGSSGEINTSGRMMYVK